MKIRQWLGFNEDASQYLLRPGELRVLNNLQSRRPGMLIARRGLKKIYGKYDDETIYGLYRRASIIGSPSDFLWFQKVRVLRTLTISEITSLTDPYEDVWMVRRIDGNQSRVIDTLPISQNGTTNISNFCIAEDRHGRMFIVYGHDAKPKLYRPADLANVALEMGLDAPLSAPSVTPSGTGYYIESIDVKSGGGSYYDPPDITILGGTPDRPAKLKSVVQSGNVVGVNILDGGANYQSTPELAAALDKIGTGFRAYGEISTAARVISGFSETAAGTVTGTAATTTETYGATNGTSDNSILYLSSPRVATEKVRSSPTITGTYSQTGTTVTVTTSVSHGLVTGQSVTLNFTSGAATDGTFTVTRISATSFSVQRATATTSGNVSIGVPLLTLGSVLGIQVGDIVTMYPAMAPFNSSTVTVTAIDSANSTVTLSVSTWVPVAGTAYEASFSRPTQVRQAKAEYDSDRRRFFANIPLTSSSATGAGAHATVEFSPQPLGYGLNTAGTSSIAVTDTLRQYLYGEYWEGSLNDVAKSAENQRYGGLQASGSSFVRGFSGSVNGRRADVYFPDYSRLSVWFCTGVYSSNLANWTRADVTVTQETIGGVTAKYLRFRLRPSAKAKTIKSLGGAAISTSLDAYEEFPDAVAPEVRIPLTECPESWVVTDADCRPTSVKEGKTNRLQWWSPTSQVSRPIVGITPSGATATASSITITDPGCGWQQGALFAFRIYQANPYAQHVNYNTSAAQSTARVAHTPYNRNGRFVEFRLTANTPDTLTPHGPPQTLITPAQVTIPGDGYTNAQTGSLTLYKRGLTQDVTAATAAQTITWTATNLQTLSATSQGQISQVVIRSKGRNYFSPPTIEVRGGGQGYGLAVEPRVENGRIESVRITDPGVGYTTQPELFTSATAAQLTPVMRPTMRGKYRCAYRFVDRSETVIKTVTVTRAESATTLTLSDTTGVKPGMILDSSSLPFNALIKSVTNDQVEINQEITAISLGQSASALVRDMSKPVAYSDLSPITDVDAGPNDDRSHCAKMEWSLPGVTPPSRADMVELWRTSADQSLVYYRLDVYGIPAASGVQIIGTDTLTDESLFDPERPNYAAMPIVLPNGSVNAYRFGKPRADMSVAVAFQDRLWMGVSTSGEGANTLYYSEFDEFESMPDVNELPIQNNQKSTDVLTALVPFGSMLLAMQHTHTYAVQYNTDPAIDVSIQMMSHRGVIHQRCWDIHENVLYAADESGIYAMSRSGEVADISMPIRDFFVSELIDFSKRERFFLQSDPRTHILRFFCCLKSNPTDTPSIALCFDIQAKTWWTESYPNSLTAACTGRPGDTRINTILLGAVDGHLYEIDGDSDHANDCITDCFVEEGGSGYREAPTISVPNCEGAVVQGVVSEGRLVDVVIQSPGWQAKGGLELMTEAGDLIATTSASAEEDGRVIGGVEYCPIKLLIGPPDPGGVQAVAYANFSVTPRVFRGCTVAQGESFVRLDTVRTAQLQRESNPPIATESGLSLFSQGFRAITSESPPVEVGMEAIGDFIPLNAFVSHIDGNNIYLKHPDGTPVSMLFGAARTNQAGTSTDYLELGGTLIDVTFRKPYRIHIPFRMATGYMQLANEENAKGGDGLIDRSVSVVYTPTPGDKEVELIERFNGREEMRPNIARRSFGGPGAFIHRQDSASTILNTSRFASARGFATGVAKAKFASRSQTDLTGEDQHLQIELYARPEQASPWRRTNFWVPDPSIKSEQPFVLHSVSVNGVVVDGE
jgi:hypothetical protein